MSTLHLLREQIAANRRAYQVTVAIVVAGLALLGLLVTLALGLGVTGAFLGTGLSVLGMAILLSVPLRHELDLHGALHAPAVHRFRDLVSRAWAPVAGLALLLTLQEIHVIVVKHEATDDAAGAKIAEVTEGSTAAEAGIEAGDVITSVDDHRITGADSLVATIRSYRPGDSVTVTWTRGGQSQQADVQLDSDATTG